MADIPLCQTLGINVCESKGNENNATSVLLCNQGRVPSPSVHHTLQVCPLGVGNQQSAAQVSAVGHRISSFI